MKKLGLGFYFSIVTVVLSVAALILYVANVNDTYYSDMNPVILGITIGAVACGVLSLVLSRIQKISILADLTLVATPVLLVMAVCMFISARAYSMAIILGSDLEKGNTHAWNALTQSFIGMAVFAAAILLAIVTAFMKQTRTLQN